LIDLILQVCLNKVMLLIPSPNRREWQVCVTMNSRWRSRSRSASSSAIQPSMAIFTAIEGCASSAMVIVAPSPANDVNLLKLYDSDQPCMGGGPMYS